MNHTLAQSTYTKIEIHYNSAQMATSAKNFLPELADFAQEFLTNPFFTDDLKDILAEQEQGLSPVLIIKNTSYKEIDAARALIARHSKKIPSLSTYLKKCDQLEKDCPPMSFNLLFHLEETIAQICSWIRLHLLRLDLNHKQQQIVIRLLAQLVNIDEEGNITEYIFSPSLKLLREQIAILERKKKTALWYSLHTVAQTYSFYDIENRENRVQSLNPQVVHFFNLNVGYVGVL